MLGNHVLVTKLHQLPKGWMRIPQHFDHDGPVILQANSSINYSSCTGIDNINVSVFRGGQHG